MQQVVKYYFIFFFLFINLSCSTESTPVYQLSAAGDPVEAGSVTPASSEYEEGETVSVTATPNENWVFIEWSGDLRGSHNPASVMMDSDKHIVAHFIKKEFTLHIQVEGEGTVTEEIIQANTTDYPHGTLVKLTANPEPGWVFIEWQGGLEGSENPETIIILEESSVTAVFVEIEHPVECEPPFWGTLWVDPNIVLPSDPSTFLGVTYEGQGTRQMHDNRHGWINAEAFLFDATYDDGLYIEIQVNPEFETPEAAEEEAEKYGWYIGQLPTELRKDVETAWIHKGNETFGGGNNNLQIHTDSGEEMIDSGLIGELFLHEAAHTSLDADHATSAGWLAAQAADNCFISQYARDYPIREDVAESFPLYFAIRYRSDRIPQELVNRIKRAIPNRIAYFDKQDFDMYPITADK
jgi:NOL1/NOP2/fmu family ribosome biogenesis protein